MNGAFLKSILRPCRVVLVAATVWGGVGEVRAQGIVPGTGVRVDEVGDDMEDPNWEFILNLPKASSEDDEEERHPLGYSTNGRWVESGLRGTPDVVRRVPTPAGGIPGSKGALLIQTLNSGIPGIRTANSMQDDLIVNGSSRLGYAIPVAWGPSIVVRVYVPPLEQWMPRADTSFGFRVDAVTMEPKKKGLLFFKRTVREPEPYWPGIFIQRRRQGNGRYGREAAYLIMRSDEEGRDLIGPEITQSGWWTLGMSFTPDGQVHYYASPGVDNLTRSDHIGSYFPYGFECDRLNTFFFNVVSPNDGRTWSTPWIIDDPYLYYAHRR